MLQHAVDDAAAAVGDLTAEQIWARPGGGASIGFHIRHLTGALDRIFTYARGEALSARQMSTLARESEPGDPPADAVALMSELQAKVDRALDQLRTTNTDTLLDARGVGRRQVPTTVLGLLVHGGEHSARHAGQGLTLNRVVRAATE